MRDLTVDRAFLLWRVPHPNDHWPREYIQLDYDGDEGRAALEFSPRELADLKAAIKRFEERNDPNLIYYCKEGQR